MEKDSGFCMIGLRCASHQIDRFGTRRPIYNIKMMMYNRKIDTSLANKTLKGISHAVHRNIHFRRLLSLLTHASKHKRRSSGSRRYSMYDYSLAVTMPANTDFPSFAFAYLEIRLLFADLWHRLYIQLPLNLPKLFPAGWREKAIMPNLDKSVGQYMY